MLGEWTAAVEHATNALADGPPPGQAASMHLALAEVYVLRGDLAAAEEELDTALPQVENSTEPKLLADIWRLRAELSVQEMKIEEVRERVKAGRAAVSAHLDADTHLQLLDIALRAEATATGRRDSRTEDIRKLERQVEVLARELPETSPLTEALVATCRAEAERSRRKNPVTWREVAQLWDAVENPYRAAYARLREAETFPVRQDAAATQKNLLHGYWLTGDLVFRDGAGLYYHVDRTTDRTLIANRPLYSCQLEELVLKHLPEVFDCTIVGVGDTARESTLAVAVEPVDNGCDPSALRKRIQMLLTSKGIHQPTHVEIIAPGWNEGLTGKKLKRVIRDSFNSAGHSSAPL